MHRIAITRGKFKINMKGSDTDLVKCSCELPDVSLQPAKSSCCYENTEHDGKTSSFKVRRNKCRKAKKKHIEPIELENKENVASNENVSHSPIPSLTQPPQASEKLNTAKIAELEAILSCKTDELQALLQANAELHDKVRNTQDRILLNAAELDKAKQVITELTKQLDQKTAELKNLKNSNTAALNLLKEKEELTAKFEKELSVKEELINKKLHQAKELEKLKAHYEKKTEEIQMQEEKLKTYTEELQHFEKILDEKQQNLLRKENVQRLITENVKRRENDLDIAKGILEAKLTELEERENELREKEMYIQHQLQFVDNLDLKIIGMKMYEELWLKKKELQNNALMEGFNKLRNKERELKEKEEYLMKTHKGSVIKKFSQCLCNYNARLILIRILNHHQKLITSLLINVKVNKWIRQQQSDERQQIGRYTYWVFGGINKYTKKITAEQATNIPFTNIIMRTAANKGFRRSPSDIFSYISSMGSYATQCRINWLMYKTTQQIFPAVEKCPYAHEMMIAAIWLMNPQVTIRIQILPMKIHSGGSLTSFMTCTMTVLRARTMAY
eukprot:TRINITY_DN1602_c0_g1_i2.p2 TRINITY_DN1602_c0_g1~~TRINITY_DN1602_c0_g1_i2.p2  ORF type:complete len:561 (+),score=63.28 TRINITY_DN1602_c0_g1_i2:802-2484(+)